MNRPPDTDTVTDADLDAYVDDQLPIARRIEVEAHLCRDPEAAARVMADLRTRDELRLALSQPLRARAAATTEEARRLQRGLGRDRLMRRLRPAAAVALFIGVGWFAHGHVGGLGIAPAGASSPPPGYVTDGMRAHRTAAVRAHMHSQPAVRDYDPAEIRAATSIAVPSLPDGWEITDVQVFPSNTGPSLELAIRSDALGTLSLFATRPGRFDVVPETLVHEASLEAAYWQIGEVAYVLVSSAPPDRVEDAAKTLSASLSNSIY